MDADELEKCRARLFSRVPLLGSWFRDQALKKLSEDGSGKAVRLLADAISRNEQPDVGQDALAILEHLASENSLAAREALCQLVWEHNHTEASRIVHRTGYEPKEESVRALFYFLTGQWDEYESLDFDHRLLRSIYERADQKLRNRIAAKARKGGRLEWVEVVQGRQGKRLGSMTDLEWKATLTVLQQRERWDDLWQLTRVAPPRWGAVMLQYLHRAAWQPADKEIEDYHSLMQLALEWKVLDNRALLQSHRKLEGHQGEVRCLAFGPDSQWVASGGADRSLRIWHIGKGVQAMKLEGHSGPINCLAFHPKGNIAASAGKDGRVCLWDLPRAKSIAQMAGDSGIILCLAMSPDGRVLVSGSADGTVSFWDPLKGSLLSSSRGHWGCVLDFSFTPDNQSLVSAGTDSVVCLWEVSEYRRVKSMRGHRKDTTDGVLCLAMNPDGRHLASGGTDGMIFIWSLPGGHLVDHFNAHFGNVASLVFNPDGDTLASGGGDQCVKFWDFPDCDLLEKLEAHSGEINRLVMSSDGRLLASVSSYGVGHDHSIRLWGVPERKPLKTLYGHNRNVSSLAISPDGQYLASGSEDGSIRIWAAELDRLSRLPVRQATLKDLVLAQESAKNDLNSEPETRAWQFIEAMIRLQKRTDIELGDPVARVLEMGEFDIEIEG